MDNKKWFKQAKFGMMNKPKNKWLLLYAVIGIFIIALNAIAWNSKTFCDAYIASVFPIWVNTYGRLTGLVPFSVGEILLALGVVLVILAAVLWVFAFAKHLRRGVRKFYVSFAWTFLAVCLVMTLNCFILYHATPFSETYFGQENEEYSLEELIAVRNIVVEECNRLSLLVERDEQGNIIYDKDIGEQAIVCMQQLGETYDRLAGFYPQPKPLYMSDFFSQQYMAGYYFPFSMEANYNQVMYMMNKPSTMCHELAHLKGYIFEDEANFISFLACIQSEDMVFQYSGYLSVLNYLDNDFYKAIGKNREVYLSEPVILAQVHADNVFVTEEEWARINGKALIDTETVDKVSDIVVDTTLKVNGVADGSISYSRVVALLLQYYIGQEKSMLLR